MAALLTLSTRPDAKPLRVPRRATALREAVGRDTRPLEDWRHLPAYVLLGDPGAGKSCSLEAEAIAVGGLLIPARDIVDGVAALPASDQTVFIDGLDEVRAGAGDGRTPLGAIRAWLVKAGNPSFRLSCREADWLGDSDLGALSRVTPGRQVEVLHLEPLAKPDVLAVLRDRPDEVPDPLAFWAQAERLGLTELFGNPLLLDLTIKAGVGAPSELPKTRHAIYDAACRRLAIESSVEHSAVKPMKPGAIDRLLHDAGLLCAVLLLSNRQSFALQQAMHADTVALGTLPAALPLPDARAALASKVFTTVAGRVTPRHRSIAEFLAAKALAGCLAQGLPLGRLLSLMQGFDGKPVEPMRGLSAWLAVHWHAGRNQLIQRDPLGIVLNGDVAAFSTGERLALLEALAEAAKQDPWFRRDAWVSHPFGALATSDMAATYQAVLDDPDRSQARQAFIDCVLDALLHGEAMPALAPALETWVVDAQAWGSNRLAAYAAWKHNVHPEQMPVKQLAWLDGIAAGEVADDDDRLTGALLTDLYPIYLGPKQVLRFLHPAKRRDLIADYSTFWRYHLLQQSRPSDFAELADAWLETKPTADGGNWDHDLRHIGGGVLANALNHAGDAVSDDRLFEWLGIALDKHGFSRLEAQARAEIRPWLALRPRRIKSLMALGYQCALNLAPSLRLFWRVEARLHGVAMPTDWLRWLLQLAESTDDEELAEYCFRRVAAAVMEPPAGFDVPSMQELETWVNKWTGKWPAASRWLEIEWTSGIDDWRGEERRQKLLQTTEELAAREVRGRDLDRHRSAFINGHPSSWLLHQVVLAQEGRFTDIQGATAVERVQDYLVSDTATAEAALESLDRVLTRDDLPSVDDILKTDAHGKHHFIRQPALLAATRIAQCDPSAPLAWPDDLKQKLIAFYLTDGTGDAPAWYTGWVIHRPELVAPILLRYATAKLRGKGNLSITGLWQLCQDADHQSLARMVLPTLLEKFPPRASEARRRNLNSDLLAGLHLLSDGEAAAIVRQKLAQPGLDAAQRICWLVAELPYRAEAAEELAVWVGRNERRAVVLGEALKLQGSLGRTVHRLPPAAVQRLIEVLGPITPHQRASGPGWVTATDDRTDTVRGLLAALSSSPDAAARSALQALAQSERLGAWRQAVVHNTVVQQSVAREALFHAANPEAVALVLANQAPANAADLLALVVQNLIDIEGKLRGEDTHLVRQFWRGEPGGQVPQTENVCRDILLDKLRDRLRPLHVLVDREASAAADKRADMCAEFVRDGRRVALPVEVKKENHPKLWTAWREQLQRLYTLDPAAGGHGLYLVLWFGDAPRATPEGIKPRDGEHLRQLLLARIPEAEHHRLGVLVLDLSLPPAH